MMRKVKIIYALLAILIVSISSCMKHDDYIMNLNSGTPNNVIYFMMTGPDVSETGSEWPRYNRDMGLYVPNMRDTFNVNVIYGGADVAPQDITVTFSKVDSLLDQFNDENGSEFVVPPASVYSIPDTVVTIKKGEKMATVRVAVVVNSDYDYAEMYALPLKIISTTYGDISSNMGTSVYSFIGRNDYDGVYQYTNSANTSLLPNSNLEVELVTVGLTKLQLSPGLVGYYTNVVQYTIDPTTNLITVTCPSLGVQTPQDTRSKYDPTTKTLQVYWKQANGARTFEEKLVYKRARD